MADIWVISDTHWNHANILTFRDRESNLIRPHFNSVEEMNETMIERWNSVVKDGDKVYHLGDVFFGPKSEYNNIYYRLKGKKRLVVGNHDNIPLLSTLFPKVEMWRMFTEFGLLLTHVPVHESTLVEKRFRGEPMINVHGHIHQNQSPSPLHRCVCVEHTNYTPIHIEEIRNAGSC